MRAIPERDRICAVVAAADAAEAMRQLAEAFELGGSIELRLDWLKGQSEIARFLAMLGVVRATLPQFSNATLIATCRRKQAGGKFGGTMREQIAILKRASEAGCAWVDLEIESASKVKPAAVSRAFAPSGCLISFHDFRRTPQNLSALARRLNRAGGDIVKIAVQCTSFSDIAAVLKLVGEKKNIVAIPMGELALSSRILALRAGSRLGYFPVANATAPGQTALREAKELYNLDHLGSRTRVYGVIGNPIGHSLSPRMHNAGFHATGFNGIYLPFLVHHLKDFVGALGELGISGFSVTIPHKQRVMQYLDRCDPLARAIGAVNTVVVGNGGKLSGYNTDYLGVLRALEGRIKLPGSRVLLLGAGGAARAAAFALTSAGAAVFVCARREAPAKELAKAVNGQTAPKATLPYDHFDLIVNTTPVGMYPNDKETPLTAKEMNCRVLFDMIYRPRETKLLKIAIGRGIETVSGLDMFAAQGAAQWELWTGQTAPTAVMREAVESTLRHEEEERTSKQAGQSHEERPSHRKDIEPKRGESMHRAQAPRST